MIRRPALLMMLCLASARTLAAKPPTDTEKALALVPPASATAVATRSGSWSSPTTWGGRLPASGDFVLIPPKIAVTQDVDSPKLDRLFVQGSLAPKPGAKVTLQVNTLVTAMASTFSAGTPTEPFTGQWNIVIADTGPIDAAADPWKFGRGVQFMGKVLLYGRDIKPYVFTAGHRAGDTVVALKSPCTGWRVGDRIVIPGLQWRVNDDDEATIAAISPDSKSLTLSAPLKFDHGVKDREGFDRPMVAANISPRSIHFSSENPAIDRRGHLMFMRDDTMTPFVLSGISAVDLGRTDKAKPVTDPDGEGGGTENERGRYSVHFHRCRPDIKGTEALVSGCFVMDSPGWGFVNHESFVSFINCVAYRIHGSHFVGENGNETGWMTDNLAIRSTIHPEAAQGGNPVSGGPLADWGKFGHGIWTHCGGIKITNCLIYGMGNQAVVLMGLPFRIGKNPQVLFEAKNLQAPYKWTPQSYGYKDAIPASWVPQQVEGVRWAGCRGGLFPWTLDGNPSVKPPVGRSLFKDCAGESDSGVVMGYLSNLDLENIRVVSPRSDYAGIAFGHTGVNSDVHYRGCSAYGYGTGVNCQTTLTNSIRDFTSKCAVGVHLNNGRGSRPLLEMERLTFLPTGKPNQANIESRVYLSPAFLRTGLDAAGNMFASFTSSTPSFATGDAVKLDGRYLYLSEEAPDFPLSNLKNCPAIFKTLTTRQLWDRHRLAFCNRRIPADAAPLAGSDCLVSDKPPEWLPQVRPNKTWGKYGATYYQQTSQTKGFVLRVKDETGQFVESSPTDLTDKAWNVVKVTVGGVERGVMVWCDSEKTFPSPW